MLIHKQNVVLETRIEMRLQPQLHHNWVVVAVDMCVYAIQPLEDLLDSGREVFGEGDADAAGEDSLVVDVRLHPCHQVLDVGWGGHLGGFWVASCGVLPEVFEFVGGFHFGAGEWGAEFGYGPVEEIDLVVEVDDWSDVSWGNGQCWVVHHH